MTREGLHWTTEVAFSEEVAIPIFDECVSIAVYPEVPMRGDERIARRGNRYFPTLVEVEAPSDFKMHPETARELGQKLIAAADAADAIDLPDCDPCGHWSPCDCGERPGSDLRVLPAVESPASE